MGRVGCVCIGAEGKGDVSPRRLFQGDAWWRMSSKQFSVKDLLQLGEQIGNVSTNLTEEMVINQMKTKTVNLEESSSEEQEADSCVICQDEYKNGEKIGILRCGQSIMQIV